MPPECLLEQILQEKSGTTIGRRYRVYPNIDIYPDAVCSNDKNYIETVDDLGSHDYGLEIITVLEIYAQCKNFIQTWDPKDSQGNIIFLSFAFDLNNLGYLQRCHHINYEIYKTPIAMP